MLMKARDDGPKPGTPPETTAQSSAPGPSKLEKEGQRPTQPVYQIQNRGMGASASSSVVDRESLKTFNLKAKNVNNRRKNCNNNNIWLSAMVGQSKLLPPEKMKHSIKLVDDQMNWCDSAMEVSQKFRESLYLMFSMLDFPWISRAFRCCNVLQYLRDQTDMLVVGVIGLQGAGKSTVMSLLSANTPEEDQR